MSDETTISGINASDIILRDSSGERKLRTRYVKEFDDEVRCLPMTKSAKEEYLTPIIESAEVAMAIDEGEIDPEELSDEELEELQGLGLQDDAIAQMLDDHYPEGKASPDIVGAYREVWENSDDERFEGEFDGLDEYFIRDVLDSDYELPLFYGVLLASDMDEQVEAHREMLDEAAGEFEEGSEDTEDEAEDEEGK